MLILAFASHLLFSLIVEKPTFSSRMNPNTLADIGTSVSLPCQTTVSGSKIWFKNAVIIRASER